MIYTKLAAPIATFVSMTIALMIYPGCEPGSSDEPTSSVNAPISDESANASIASDGEAVVADGKATVIDGDLAAVDWKSLLGQKVTITGELKVVDQYDLARRGQVVVARDRLFIPTNTIDPNDKDPHANSFTGGNNVAKVVKAQKFNDAARIILDDGLRKENVFPPSLFPGLGKTHPTVRIGSTLDGVSGKLVKERNNIVLVPDGPLKWTPAKRPERPEVGDADVTVASFNVLNFFSTIDNGRNQARGADSKSELKRQEAKIVAAVIALKADVIGLMELENNLKAEKRLVEAVNSKLGQEVFKYCGVPDGFRAAPGGKNAIRVGIIYRNDRVTPVGKVAMINDEAFDGARTPIVQQFKSNSSGKQFSLVVNHFKSKGGSDRADVANKNKGDGQGAYNAKRRAQSLAICNYVEQQQKIDDKARILVVGDLNAYGQEDPVDAFRANGLVDLHERFTKSENGDSQHYSYIYYGQCGSLDHVLSTGSLADDVTGVATWHINSDEPRFLDYNEEFNPKPLYEATPFRSSDHDPVLIGIGN